MLYWLYWCVFHVFTWRAPDWLMWCFAKFQIFKPDAHTDERTTEVRIKIKVLNSYCPQSPQFGPARSLFLSSSRGKHEPERMVAFGLYEFQRKAAEKADERSGELDFFEWMVSLVFFTCLQVFLYVRSYHVKPSELFTALTTHTLDWNFQEICTKCGLNPFSSECACKPYTLWALTLNLHSVWIYYNTSDVVNRIYAPTEGAHALLSLLLQENCSKWSNTVI